MFQNYIMITLRSMRKNILSSVLTLFGLSLGLAASIMGWLFLENEMSYDSFYSNSDQVVRINRGIEYSEGQTEENPGAPYLLSPQIKEQVSGVREVTRFWPTNGTALVAYGDKKFNERGVAQADGNFFKVFDIPFLLGDPERAITEPGTVVLSERLATKYFGSPEEAIGKVLSVYRRGDVRVTGVFANLPSTSHLDYDLVVSMSTTSSDFWMFQYWQINFFHTYVLIEESVTLGSLRQQLNSIAQQIPENNQQGKTYFNPWLVRDIHMHSDLANELKPHNAIEMVERFTLVTLLIVLVSCFNYINMATAFGAMRAKEIAIRQVLGGRKLQLSIQFLVEAFINTLFAFVLALVLVEFGVEVLNNFLDKTLPLVTLVEVKSIFVLASLVLGVSFASGAYPAFSFSKMDPAKILQGSKGAKVKQKMRQSLVLVQVTIASILILAITVVTHQNWYIDGFSRGYNPENLVVLSNLDDSEVNIPVLKSRLLENPDIQGVGASTNIPTSYLSHATLYEASETTTTVGLTGLNIGEDFFGVFEIDLLAGRNFSEARPNDDVNNLAEGVSVQKVIINELAARNFGWAPDEAIGKLIQGEERQMEIIGVVENIHFGSIREPIVPVSYQLNSAEYNYLTIRLSGNNQAATISLIDRLAQELSPIGQPPLRDTIEERYQGLYANEQNQQKILTFFSVLVVVISGLGLFALANFIVKNRSLEIAIRKVLGARSGQIITLMLSSFGNLVLVANVLALPIAGWLMMDWLNQFQYRIELGVFHFLFALGITSVIALATTFGQTLRISQLRPVHTLRQS